LNPQNRLKDSIAKRAEQKEIAGGKFACTLEIGFNMWRFSMKKDCARVKPKRWMDKQIWIEINDILRECIKLHGLQRAKIAAG